MLTVVKMGFPFFSLFAIFFVAFAQEYSEEHGIQSRKC